MKTGILTFHAANNFGAVLQATSLQNIIAKDFDCNCEVIDYTPDFIAKDYTVNPFNTSKPKTALKNILRIKDKMLRNKGFDRFRSSNIQLSPKCERQNFSAFCKQYDRIIVGSDQVWNYRLTQNDVCYFLKGVSDSVKRYAYAVSTGDASFTDSFSANMVGEMEKFNVVSVREKSSQEMLSKCTGRSDVSVVLDPVFLTRKDEWKKIASGVQHEDYILFFKMGYSQKADPALNFAKNLSKKTGYKLLMLWDQEMWFRYRDIQHVGAVAPDTFLGYIANAKCVVTNSFHATAFSVIFNTPFYVETEIDRKDRVLNLLNTFKLNEQGLCKGKTFSDFGGIPEINWESVNTILDEEREKSLIVLKQMIE